MEPHPRSRTAAALLPCPAFAGLDAAPPPMSLPYRGRAHAGVRLGTVLGAALNQREEQAALAPQMNAAPYQRPPQRPVLYIKPANTLVPHGAHIALDPHLDAVSVAACLGIVLGAALARASAAQALEAVLGYTIAADLSVPHASYFRPAIREKCQDGFCPIGPCVIPREAVEHPDALEIVTTVDGVPAHRSHSADLVRSCAVLLADLSQFMTLQPGDVILAGPSQSGALAHRGAQVEVRIAALGVLAFSLAGARASAGADAGVPI